MHESQELAPLKKSLASQSPWLLIAIFLHAAIVAVASILYYEHASTVDDGVVTEITLTARAPVMADVLPPEIVDRPACQKSRSKSSR